MRAYRPSRLSSHVVFLTTSLAALAAGTLQAQALVQVQIDLTRQRMHVNSNEGSYDWPISSARSGFSTPGGSYAPTHLELMHYSKKYNMAPMPHAIFFRGGYAIHGTYETSELGRPASHGCVRLSPGNATTLYDMVKAEGARIGISGTPPASRPFAVAHHRAHRYATYAQTSGYADADDGYVQSPRRTRGAGYGGYYGYGAAQPTDGATNLFGDFGQ